MVKTMLPWPSHSWTWRIGMVGVQTGLRVGEMVAQRWRGRAVSAYVGRHRGATDPARPDEG